MKQRKARVQEPSQDSDQPGRECEDGAGMWVMWRSGIEKCAVYVPVRASPSSDTAKAGRSPKGQCEGDKRYL